ncbi:hypothetical protein [Streptomyces sp. NPDC102264]|uniref:hypothetical protein n=1 Tax=Streptomyces sp. NPDC102264 TaxID=3366149 RepID=UPI003807A355
MSIDTARVRLGGSLKGELGDAAKASCSRASYARPARGVGGLESELPFDVFHFRERFSAQRKKYNHIKYGFSAAPMRSPSAMVILDIS